MNTKLMVDKQNNYAYVLRQVASKPQVNERDRTRNIADFLYSADERLLGRFREIQHPFGETLSAVLVDGFELPGSTLLGPDHFEKTTRCNMNKPANAVFTAYQAKPHTISLYANIRSPPLMFLLTGHVLSQHHVTSICGGTTLC